MYVCTPWDSSNVECGGVGKEGISVLYRPEKRAIIFIHLDNNNLEQLSLFD